MATDGAVDTVGEASAVLATTFVGKRVCISAGRRNGEFATVVEFLPHVQGWKLVLEKGQEPYSRPCRYLTIDGGAVNCGACTKCNPPPPTEAQEEAAAAKKKAEEQKDRTAEAFARYEKTKQFEVGDLVKVFGDGWSGEYCILIEQSRTLLTKKFLFEGKGQDPRGGPWLKQWQKEAGVYTADERSPYSFHMAGIVSEPERKKILAAAPGHMIDQRRYKRNCFPYDMVEFPEIRFYQEQKKEQEKVKPLSKAASQCSSQTMVYGHKLVVPDWD